MGAGALRADRAAVAAMLGAALLVGCSDGDAAEAFEVTDASSEIVATEDGVALRVSATVVNVSGDVLDGVTVSFVPDDALDPYLVAGAVVVPFGSVDDIYPEDTAPANVPADGARGIEVEVTRHLVGAGADLAEVLGLAQEATFEVTWDGGRQLLTSATPVADPDGLLEG